MDGLTLLAEARDAGLQVTVSGDQLVVRGPARLAAMARRLLAGKPAIVDALTAEQEVAWRIEAMRPQVTRTGAIPLLLARPGAPWDRGCCCSCGEPLTAADHYRCRYCAAASVAVLDELP